MNEFVSILLIITALTLQYFLSSRNNLYLSAIIPILFVVGLTWMLVIDRIESIFAYVLFLVIGLIFLLQQWSSGRKSFHRNRRKELEKMKKYDIK